MLIPIYRLSVPVPSTFQYRPLDSPRHFRLLKLHPDHFALRRDAPWLVEYELVHVSLDSPPSFETASFETASYTSAGSSRMQLIHLRPNSQTLAVSGTVVQMLNRLKRDSTTAFIWIDQICINQDDESDRSRHSSILEDICGHAEKSHLAHIPTGRLIPAYSYKVNYSSSSGIKETGVQNQKDDGMHMDDQHETVGGTEPCQVNAAYRCTGHAWAPRTAQSAAVNVPI